MIDGKGASGRTGGRSTGGPTRTDLKRAVRAYETAANTRDAERLAGALSARDVIATPIKDYLPESTVQTTDRGARSWRIKTCRWTPNPNPCAKISEHWAKANELPATARTARRHKR